MIIDWSAAFAVLVALVALVAVGLAIWFSRNRRVTYQADTALEDYGRRLDELTLQVVELKLALSHYKVGTATLTAQVIRLGEAPEWRPEVFVQRSVDEEPLVRIYQLIIDHFSIAEMDELAAAAGIPTESYGGHEAPARALSLVKYAARHGQLEDLVAVARKRRPKVRWPAVAL